MSRAWRDGFFSARVALDRGVMPLASTSAAARMAPAPTGARGDDDDGKAAQHDETLPIAARMAIAVGGPPANAMRVEHLFFGSLSL